MHSILINYVLDKFTTFPTISNRIIFGIFRLSVIGEIQIIPITKNRGFADSILIINYCSASSSLNYVFPNGGFCHIKRDSKTLRLNNI